MTDEVRLVGDRVMLRPLTISDVGEAYQEWMNDSEVTKYLESRFTRYTLEDLRQYVESMSAREDVVFLAIIRRLDGRHVGNIKLGPISRVHLLADIGILIGDRSAWGKGIATESIVLLTRHAFETLKLHKLTAGCYASNEASARAFLSAGFEEEGRRRAHTWSEHGWEDNILLGRVNLDPIPAPRDAV